MQLKIIKIEALMRYELFIIVGLFMTAGTLIKLIGIYDPYPVNQGDAYWEDFDFWNLDEHRNIYVY